MIADELYRTRPHGVHARGGRTAAETPARGEGRHEDPQAGQSAGPARTVHRLRRIRQVSEQAINVIDEALQGAS